MDKNNGYEEEILINNIDGSVDQAIIADVENGKYVPVDTEEFNLMNNMLKDAASNTMEKLIKREEINH